MLKKCSVPCNTIIHTVLHVSVTKQALLRVCLPAWLPPLSLFVCLLLRLYVWQEYLTQNQIMHCFFRSRSIPAQNRRKCQADFIDCLKSNFMYRRSEKNLLRQRHSGFFPFLRRFACLNYQSSKESKLSWGDQQILLKTSLFWNGGRRH